MIDAQTAAALLSQVRPDREQVRPDWVFGTQDKRVPLTFGGVQFSADDPNYDLIRRLILEQKMNELSSGYGR